MFNARPAGTLRILVGVRRERRQEGLGGFDVEYGREEQFFHKPVLQRAIEA